MGKLLSTLLGVVLAVGGLSGLWIGANLVFNQATRDFRRFSGIVGAVVGALALALIDGNQLLTGLVARPSSLFNGEDPGLFTDGFATSVAGHLFWPLVGAVFGAVVGIALSMVQERMLRLAISVGAGVALGVILSFALRTRYELAMRSTPLIIWTVVLAAIGAAVAIARRGNPITGGLTGAFIGWLVGAFGGALHGVSVSNQTETTIAFVVAGALAGARLGLTKLPDSSDRARIDDRSRAWLFIGPAVAFITIMLGIPVIQTMLLSLQEDDAENVVDGFVGLDNYEAVFSNPSNLDTADVSQLFTSASETSTSIFPWGGSALLPWVLFFAVAGLLIALLLGRETGERLNITGAPLVPLILAVALFSFAVFTHLRGTIINNLWWVVAVTLLSTSLGLAIAKLSDGAKFEAVAKSFVFMPMAISFVGASIIWRLMMFQARDVSKSQTGVFNAIWVWLGRNTTEWGSAGGAILGLILAALAVAALVGTLILTGRLVGPVRLAGGVVGGIVVLALLVLSLRAMGGKLFIGGVFLAAALALAWSAYQTLRNSTALSALYLTISIVPLWVAYRTLGDGIGGFQIGDDGAIRSLPVNFVQGIPYNNFWLMVILVWIQTGFAMVILSAAIKAVPDELIEAGQIDGASEGQIFWRVTVPQIAPTIGVVGTTIMVNVMKVFDIVKVTTNGQFGSQVLANAMFEQAFLFSNRGLGAALAVLLFVGILPVMVYNIYRLTREV